MIRNADLMSYLPPVLQDVREIQVTFNAEDPEFQLVFDTSELVLNNLYIKTADIDGIARFEKILGIRPSENDTLETRRFRVLSRWNDRIPYTWKALLEKLDTLCGEGNYTISLDNDIYTLNVETHLGEFGTVDELNIMLKEIIPCNLVIVATNVLSAGDESPTYIGSAMVSSQHYVLTPDINGQYEINADSFVGSVVVDSAAYQLTNDVNVTMTSSGEVKNASVPVVGSHVQIT